MRRSIVVAFSLLGIGGLLPAQDGGEAPKEPPKVALFDLVNEVEGTTTILKLAPEGTWVTKGQMIATLDDAALRDQLINQEIRVQSASADLEQARSALPVAEIALQEYMNSTYPTSLKLMQADLNLAEDEIALLSDELDAVEKSTTATPLQRRRAHFDLSKAKNAAEQIRGKLDVLQKYSKPAVKISRQADIDTARSRMLSTKQAFELERAKEDKLRRQIVKCTILAPADGVLIHPNPTGTTGGDSPIEEGARVREGQLLLRIARVSLG